MTDVDEVYCDDIVVLGDAGAQPFDFIAQSNHYLDDNMQVMTLRAAENQQMYFQLDWDAINGSATSPAFNIRLEIDGVPIFTENNPGVDPNTTHETVSSVWTATLGEHALLWTIDSGNQVPEGNENNNTVVDTFLVLPTTAFDFSADNAWIADTDTVEVEPAEGQEILFVLDWSVPLGTGNSPPFNISFDFNGEDYFSTSILPVQSGQTYQTIAQPAWTAVLGWNYYEWFIDPENNVEEFSESNNYMMGEIDPVGIIWDPFQLNETPESFQISHVYPNPFNPSVVLQYENVAAGIMKLSIFDVAGREIAVLADGFHQAGVWEITFSGENIAAGAYFAVLDCDGKRSVQPLLLVK